jgi:hypothetical protein
VRRWTRDEEALLEREYSKRKISEIEKMLGRSDSSIQSKAKDMGLSKPQRFFQAVREQRADEELRINIRVKTLGDGSIPQMPGLLDHLLSMSGSMDSVVVMPHAGQRASLAHFEKIRPRLEELLSQKIKYAEIAKEIGMSYYTVFEYAKKIRAAA